MDDSDSFGDSWDNLSWFAYGYLCGEEDGRRQPDPQGDAFGCLAVVVLVVCGFLWALADSIAFAVICGLIALVVAWKLCYGSRAKERDDEGECAIRRVWRGEKKSVKGYSRGMRK